MNQIQASRAIVLAVLPIFIIARGGTTPASAVTTDPSGTPPLTIEKRVAAQRSIERVYYSHRQGTNLPFDQVVPAGLLDRKVRKYLKQTVALEEFWHTPVTTAALRRELERMTANSRFPERLAEIRAALNGDEQLMMETLAREALVDRLTRAFLSADERLQGPARQEALQLHRRLVDGRLSPSEPLPHRSVLEVHRSGGPSPPGERTREARGATPGITLDNDEFDDWRKLQPAVPGQIGPLVEGPDDIEFSVILSENDNRVEMALYTIPKLTWDDWWAGASSRFDESKVLETRSGTGTEESPGVTQSSQSTMTASPQLAAPCSFQELWSAGHTDSLPLGRRDHTAVWTGSEMIIWGGQDKFNNLLNSGARYDPAIDVWKSVSSIGVPVSRTGHRAVWTGTYMIVWGGDLIGAATNTGGRYDPISDTWQSTSTVNAPSARFWHTAVWTGSRMIIWGGGITNTNTGGVYDPAADTWMPTSVVNAPTARSFHMAVWTGTEMIIWGGGAQNTNGGRYNPLSDTWLPTSTVDAPSPRNDSTAVWTGSRMIIWGSAGGFLPTGGLYDPVTDQWFQMSQNGAASNRYGHSSVWTGSELMVWGGTDMSQTPSLGVLNTGATYNPVSDSWIAMTTLNAPTARSSHSAVWGDGLMVIWGGFGVSLSSGGRYNPSSDSWTPTRNTRESPAGQWGTSSVWTGTEMIVWGGGATTTGARYDAITDSWHPMTAANAPATRQYVPAIWTGTEMIVWGGGDNTPNGSGGAYNPAADTWELLTQVNAPEARSDHTAIWTGTEMIVWGGKSATAVLDSGSRYNPVLKTWSPTRSSRAPSPRWGHTAIWSGDEMIIWGGTDDGFIGTGTGGRYSPSRNSWTSTTTNDSPSPRWTHSAIWTGTEMIVYGSESDSRTGGRYDPSTGTWAAISTLNAPISFGHTAVWTGTEMIVWGGADLHLAPGYGYSVNTGARYDPALNTWTPTTTMGAPSPRAAQVALWTGGAMIAWGGEYWSGDIITPINDPTMRWYGSMSAASPGDFDGDGVSNCFDCNDLSASAWGTPGEVSDLEFLGDGQTLTWQPLGIAGGLGATFDTLRSVSSADFLGPASCLESLDGSDMVATDAAVPPAGDCFYYLVRARNNCPLPWGMGSVGANSAGAVRAARSCP